MLSNTALIRKGISSLQFGMYTDDEVRARSVREVTSPISYDALGNPLSGGLYDPVFGPDKRDLFCITCGQNNLNCPGHFGHIELCVPLYHPLLFKDLVKVLRLKCLNCHDLRVGKKDSKIFAAKLALIEHGKVTEALELDSKLKALQANHKKNPESTEDENVYVKHLLDRYAFRPSKTVLTSHERSIQRDLIKEFLSVAIALPKCKNCSACSPKIRQDANNKIFQSPLSGRDKMSNSAEGIKIRPATSPINNENKDDIDAFESDDESEDGEDITGEMEINKEKKKRTKEGDKFMSALEVQAQLQLTWRLQPYLCSRVFASAHCQDDSLVKGYSVFFIMAVAAPPSRFRPAMVLGTMTSEHAQTTNLAKILQLNDIIRTKIALIQQLKEEQEKAIDAEEALMVQEGQRKAEANMISTWINLQTSLNLLYDSSKSDSNSADIPNGIRQLLEKKEGIFRKHIMGKRVNFACRSVISPDPYIGTNEIGIPVKFAKTLTYPTPVTPLNVEEMRKIVIKGPNDYPGAVWVEEIITGRRYFLSKMTRLKREGLAARLLSARGQIRVGRQLVDGDMMLLNRQPTLHKPGIMAHRVRILHDPHQQTIRMHYANCNTYNADFDGDEMNAHFPQNDIARAESHCIMNTDLQYIVPTDGSPLRGLIQDHVDSGVKLTKLDTFLEKWEYQQLLFAALASLTGLELIRSSDKIEMVPPAIRKPKELWTGKQVITTILNHLRKGNDSDIGNELPGISVEFKAKTPPWAFGESYLEHRVIVRNGELLRGVLDKAAFGSAEFSLVHAVYEAYGPAKAGLLLNSLGRVFTSYLQYFAGHSCRMEDLVLKETANQSRRELVEKSYNVGARAAKAWADSEGGKSQIPEITNDEPLKPFEAAATAKKIGKLLSGKEGPNNSASLDAFMQGQLNPLASKIIKVCLPDGLAVRFPTNTFGLMVTTGAKGSTVNQSQVSCALGQQALEGRRVPRMPSGRTLPSFAPFDPNPRADGFIADRFLTGVRPQEYYFHCMAGREGLVDTAVKTSRSGYLQRCLVKHLEELKVCYDSTVRNSEGGVVQFLYGEDGIDPTKAAHLDCSPGTMEYFARNKKAFQEKYKPLPNSSLRVALDDHNRNESLSQGKETLEKGHLVDARRLRIGKKWVRGALCSGWHRATILKVRQSESTADLQYQSDGSIVKRVPLYATFSNAGTKHYKAANSKFTLVKAAVPDPILSDVERGHRIGVSGSCVSERVAHETMNLIKNNEQLKQVMKDSNTSPKELEHIVSAKYSSSLIAPGEAVGSIAAQSVGEPSTQMTLNTFHLAGCAGAANVTLGIPRLREIIMTASRTLKTPTMSVPLYQSLSERDATRLARSFNKITLRELIASKGGIQVKETLQQSPDGSWERAYYIIMKLHPEERIQEAFGLSIYDIASKVGENFVPLLSKKMQMELKKANSNMEVHGGYQSSEFVEVSKKSSLKKKSKEREEYEDEATNIEDGVSGSRFGHRKEIATYDMDDEEKKLAKEFATDDIEDNFYDMDDTAVVTDNENMDPTKASDEVLKVDRSKNKIILQPLRVDPAAQPLLMVGLVEDVASQTIVKSKTGIDQAFINDEEDNRGRCLQTAGCHFSHIWSLPENVVNHNLLLSNDIWQVCVAYGVEAGRQTIVDQIRSVFAVYGISVDPRHLTLIADYMTYDGGYKPMNRIGMLTSSSGFLKMSFETTATFLVEAAMKNHTESLVSPSANIVVGKPIHHGTGAFECVTLPMSKS